MIQPPAGYTKFLALGVKRGNTTIPQIIVIGILAGWYIGFGMLLAMTCGMDTPDIAKGNLGLTKMLAGLYGLPFGLFMAVMTASDLCTANFAMVAIAWFEGKITWKQALKSCVVSWGANFLGSLFLAWLVSASHSVPHHAIIVKVTTTKAHLPFHVAVAKGVLCNWLVCTAVALASGTDSVIGKFICILVPISIFVSEGFEHCVANMFAMPFGIFMGAKYSVHRMIVHNILPVTLGNFLGAVGPVAFMFWVGYGSRNGKPLPTWCPSGELEPMKKESTVTELTHNGHGDVLAVTTHSEA